MTSKSSRLANGYFLGFFFFLVVLLVWLRGMSRLIFPVVILCLVGYGVNRFIKMIREPVDD